MMDSLSPLDWIFIAAYFAFTIWVGVAFSKKGGANLRNYFLAGGNLPWWLLGTSMVATTFSAGTPLLVAGWAHDKGIAKNWEWWSLLIGAMLTTFLFARLWGRTGVMTDAEYIELRYSGKSGSILRGFRALYMGFIMNTFVIGSGLVAIAKIGTSLLGYDTEGARWAIAAICGLTALFYSTMSGLTGVVITDFVQFCIAMIGSILICIFACTHPSVGGLARLTSTIQSQKPELLHFFPQSWESAGTLGFWALAVYLSVRWWSQVYGGAEPGGASHVAQRMLAARSERDAMLGTLWFNIAHYALRPWPWILTGLAAVLIFPDIADGEAAYVKTITLLPAGIRGLVLAGFFAAFMSTIDTRLNLGSAYFVNDFYKRFIVPHRDEKHYVSVSRSLTVFQLLMGFGIMLIAEDVKDLFFLYTALGSGSGLIFIVRWYWWRVTAWSEIAAMSAALGTFVLLRFGIYPSAAEFNAHALTVLLTTTVVVTVIWIAVALLTEPASMDRLKAFYAKIRPGGPFWSPVVAALHQDGQDVAGDRLTWPIVGWISATFMVYAGIVGVGKLCLRAAGPGLLALVLCGVAAGVTWLAVNRMTTDERTGADSYEQ